MSRPLREANKALVRQDQQLQSLRHTRDLYRSGLWSLAVLTALCVFMLLGCAHWNYCRSECDEYRSPAWSWGGGPVMPSDKHDRCMDRCRSKSQKVDGEP